MNPFARILSLAFVTLLSLCLVALWPALAGVDEIVPRPKTDVPNGTGDRFKNMWLEGQKMRTWAVALEDSITSQQAECTAIDSKDTAKISACDEQIAHLNQEWEKYNQARANYEQRLADLWAECEKAWEVAQILPSTGARDVNAYGCSLRPGTYSPKSAQDNIPEKGLIIKEPPSPIRPKVDLKIFPEKEVMKLGPEVASMVLDSLNQSMGDLRNSERDLEYRSFSASTPDYPLEQSASFLTGMRYGAERVGASPRPVQAEDLRRAMLPTETLDRLSIFTLPPAELIKRPDEPSAIALFDERNRIAEEALRAEGGNVDRAIANLEQQALGQPISSTHLALRTLQGIQVYLSTLPAQ